VENLEFEAPGPGSWTLETVHFNRPISLYAKDMFFDALMEGMNQSNEHYGSPLASLEFRSVNRLMYNQPRPVGAPEGATDLPPKWLFKIIQFLHPAVRKRRNRAKWALKTKAWRKDIELWDNAIKPGVLARAAEIRAVDPAALDDEDLIAHLKECDEFIHRTVVNHHRFNNTFGLPLGDFMYQSIGWTGLPAGELLRLFEGYSEVSRGSMGDLQALRDALGNDPEMTALIQSDEPSEEILKKLQKRNGAVGEAINAYINSAGYCMLTGYDVADMMAIESPDTLLKLIRTAIQGGAQEGALAGDKATSEIRAKVPDEHLDLFDEMLTEARLAYRMRDERGYYGDAMSVALARRAILEMGRRLTERGLIKDPIEAPEATHEELVGLLRGASEPSADELHARSQYRLNTTVDIAPPFLGPEPTPMPPVEWFPKSVRRFQGAVIIIFKLMFESGNAKSDDNVVRGLGVYPGTYEGPARLIDGIEDFEKIEEGDVLVARTTSPSINVFLPLLGAMVVDRGGLLSHAAIVAREYGLPAVVGCGDATERLSDGMRVRVDGEKGEVCVLD